MWIWRRMEKISWREHVRNEEVLRRVGEERSLRNTIWKRKARWIGHVMRQKEGMLRTVIEGRAEGKRSRGRLRMSMLDDIKQGRDYHVIKNEAFDRKRWRTTVLEGPALGQTTWRRRRSILSPQHSILNGCFTIGFSGKTQGIFILLLDTVWPVLTQIKFCLQICWPKINVNEYKLYLMKRNRAKYAKVTFSK